MEFLATSDPTALLNEQLASLRSVCDSLHLNTASEPLPPAAKEAMSLHTKRRSLMTAVVDGEWHPYLGDYNTYVGPWLSTRADAESAILQRPVSSRKIMEAHRWTANAGMGADMKQRHFHLIPKIVFLNTGSYGACPTFTQEGRSEWEKLEMEDPIRWRFHMVPFQLRAVTNRLAKFVNCPPANITLLMNCNTATSTVLKSLPWECGDLILMLSCDYDATKLAAQFLEENFGVETLYIEIVLPLTDDEILFRVESFLHTRKKAGLKLPVFANFCHVTSKTAWVFPAKRLVSLCHRYGIPTMIDGAQAPGHISVDIVDIGADYYCGTCHKWMFSCQGIAFLAVSPSKAPLLVPLAPKTPFEAEFGNAFSQSFADEYSAFLALNQAFDFVDMICGGWNRVWAYQRRLAQQAVKELQEMWNLAAEGLACIQRTQMQDPDTNKEFNCMPLVPLPKSRYATQSDATTLIGYLLTKFKITAFILVEKFVLGDGEIVPLLVIRISCAIHVSMEDIRHLGRAVKELDGRYGAVDMMKEYLPEAIQGMIS